jgi:protein-S-isoprenylcysteine O-methyltransferase Ste14
MDRLEGTRRKESPHLPLVPWLLRWLSVCGAFFFILFVIAGFDICFSNPHTVPLALQVAGLVLYAAGLSLGWWATSANTFFSRMVRIQKDRGQYVITATTREGCGHV